MLHAQRAWILLRTGETAAALEALRRRRSRLLTDPLELGKAYVNRGGVHLSRGAGRPTALRLRDRGVDLFDELGTQIEAAMAGTTWATRDLLQGDLVCALRHMDAVRPVLLPQSPVARARSATRTGPRC